MLSALRVHKIPHAAAHAAPTITGARQQVHAAFTHHTSPRARACVHAHTHTQIQARMLHSACTLHMLLPRAARSAAPDTSAQLDKGATSLAN